MHFRFLPVFLAAAMGTSGPLVAQDVPKVIEQQAEPSKSAEQIAKELANPNTPLASLNFKNQFRWFEGSLPGADGQFGYTMLAQPAFPFALENGDQVLFRPALPIIFDQPVFNPLTAGFDSESGLGDFAFDLAYAPKADNGMLYAFGLISSLPIATNGLGNRQWTLGPEVLVGKITDKYVLGVFPNHQWDVAGWGDNSVNLTTIQLFGTWLPGGGWSVGTAPILSYDWGSNQWNIPLNLNFGKTVILGGKPWKLSAEVNYYVERPDTFGAEWMVGINITPVVENVLAKMFD
ncbi:hypothetical protein [Haloferula sp.]|uniref:hypothetical protein n=1 Tax=Haloferula sp. TaxID=2497595 RepID=UPI0032A0DAE6